MRRSSPCSGAHRHPPAGSRRPRQLEHMGCCESPRTSMAPCPSPAEVSARQSRLRAPELSSSLSRKTPPATSSMRAWSRLNQVTARRHTCSQPLPVDHSCPPLVDLCQRDQPCPPAPLRWRAPPPRSARRRRRASRVWAGAGGQSRARARGSERGSPSWQAAWSSTSWHIQTMPRRHSRFLPPLKAILSRRNCCSGLCASGWRTLWQALRRPRANVLH
mmetsp:Transcript_54957/g.170561  ORF Transcript_54957/g.170561 Transcript_54957/m.170561 type:complete len:218 (+) Transcript_54957:57-710(+)